MRPKPFDQAMEFEAGTAEIVDIDRADRAEPGKHIIRVEPGFIPTVTCWRSTCAGQWA
jgi:hypothetical protein